jgi:hypothetical protein
MKIRVLGRFGGYRFVGDFSRPNPYSGNRTALRFKQNETSENLQKRGNPMRLQRHLLPIIGAAALAIAGNAALGVPVTAQHHHDAKALVRDKLKQDGHHDIDHKGKYTTSVEVKGGKIAALHVKHSEKGDIPVKKYKTHKKMAQTGGGHLMYASFRVAQMQDMGTEYIGYSYVDDAGNEEIYWFPAEEVYDGDTGAVEYIPLSS